MKKLYLPLALMGVALLAASCEENYWINGEQYDTVMNYKNGGDIEFDYFTVNADVTQTINIGKGGHNTGSEPTVTLVPYTQEELAEYNTATGQNFKLIPPEYYTLPQTLTFAANEMYKNVDFVLKGEFTGIVSKDDKYILPVKLQTNLGTVNEEKDLIYLKPTILVPKIQTSAGEVQECPIPGESENPTFHFDYEWYLDVENQWNFTVNFETEESELQKEVDNYNISKGTDYALLPVANYSLPSTLAFTPGENSQKLSVSVTKDANLLSGDYLLPVKVKSVDNASFGIDVSSTQTRYILVTVLLGQIQLGTEFSESVEATLWANNQLSYQDVGFLFDGITDDADKCWHSQWYDEGNGQNQHDPTYGVYLDITLKQPLTEELQFYYWTRTYNNCIPSHIKVYGGTSQEDLQLIQELKLVEDNLPTGAGAKYVSPKMSVEQGKAFSLVRVAILESYDGGNDSVNGPLTTPGEAYSIALGELELYGK